MKYKIFEMFGEILLDKLDRLGIYRIIKTGGR